jgi:hypothetical protein
VLSFYSTAWMADTCQFVSIYRVVSLAHQNGWGLYGVQAERRFWVWVGYLSKYFCRERNLVYCVLGERAMDGCVCAMRLGLLYRVVPLDWMFWDGFYWGDERGND